MVRSINRAKCFWDPSRCAIKLKNSFNSFLLDRSNDSFETDYCDATINWKLLINKHLCRKQFQHGKSFLFTTDVFVFLFNEISIFRSFDPSREKNAGFDYYTGLINMLLKLGEMYYKGKRPGKLVMEIRYSWSYGIMKRKDKPRKEIRKRRYPKQNAEDTYRIKFA